MSAFKKPTREQEVEQDYLNYYAKCVDPKYQLIDGQIVLMAPPNRNHTKIVSNFDVKISNHLKKIGRKCDVLPEKGAILIPNSDNNHYQPDLLVECEPIDNVFSYNPILIVEVLSKDRNKDLKEKFEVYKTYDSLLEYVVVEQYIMRITVYRKSENWQAVDYTQWDTILLESIGLEINVEEFYENIDFDENGVAYPLNRSNGTNPRR